MPDLGRVQPHNGNYLPKPILGQSASMADDRPTNFIEQFRTAQGLSREALARAAGVSFGQLVKLERGERRLSQKWADMLAPVLKCSPGELLDGPRLSEPSRKSDVDMSRRIPTAEGLRDLPVYGSVKGSFVGEAVDALNPVEWLVRPAILIGVAKGFGVYVVGPSMEPRYHQGEIVLVHPGRPAARGGYVVVMLADDTAILKKLLRQTDDFVEVEQLNPPEKTRLPRAKVAGVYRVVGTQEG